MSHEMDRNLNISPKMSYGVLECNISVTELHAYDFAIEDFVIHQEHYLCRALYLSVSKVEIVVEYSTHWVVSSFSLM